jgi:hypothetical protein
MRLSHASLPSCLLALALVAALPGCSSNDGPTGQACDVVDDCYPGVDPADVPGTIECLDRVTGGYCTHTCASDAECCSVDGECDTAFPEVCAPLESTGVDRCFLSCEDAVVGDIDPNTYCADHANRDFTCRSTGGGSQNRKVCLP